eukprot:scaffold20743_cov62-Phaeocystis_antarctica.AAC.7
MHRTAKPRALEMRVQLAYACCAHVSEGALLSALCAVRLVLRCVLWQARSAPERRRNLRCTAAGTAGTERAFGRGCLGNCGVSLTSGREETPRARAARQRRVLLRHERLPADVLPCDQTFATCIVFERLLTKQARGGGLARQWHVREVRAVHREAGTLTAS